MALAGGVTRKRKYLESEDEEEEDELDDDDEVSKYGTCEHCGRDDFTNGAVSASQRVLFFLSRPVLWRAISFKFSLVLLPPTLFSIRSSLSLLP